MHSPCAGTMFEYCFASVTYWYSDMKLFLHLSRPGFASNSNQLLWHKNRAAFGYFLLYNELYVLYLKKKKSWKLQRKRSHTEIKKFYLLTLQITIHLSKKGTAKSDLTYVLSFSIKKIRICSLFFSHFSRTLHSTLHILASFSAFCVTDANRPFACTYLYISYVTKVHFTSTIVCMCSPHLSINS